VAAETEGGTPISISKGLKILPPPRPKAPDIIPPKNEQIRRDFKLLLRLMSASF